MKTINREHYVSLEIANLLKEAGFDWKQYSFYNSKGILINGTFDANWNDKIWYIDGNKVTAPTLDVAQRWLREVMNLSVHVFMSPYQSEDKYKWAYSIIYEVCIERYKTYEEAQEAGIKKALEIILEKGE